MGEHPYSLARPLAISSYPEAVQCTRALASAPGSSNRDNSWGWGVAVNLTLLNTVCLSGASRAPGRPDDVAAAVTYPACLEASFVTGEVLNVNGGWLVGR